MVRFYKPKPGSSYHQACFTKKQKKKFLFSLMLLNKNVSGLVAAGYMLRVMQGK